MPVHFLTLATLQAEFNDAVLAAQSAGITTEQEAFNKKVSEALFSAEPVKTEAPDPAALVVPPEVTSKAQ